jgi:anaerobic selenocysteine-containing dehydrogenase
LINPQDMARNGLSEGQVVGLASDAGDGRNRFVGGLKVTPFDLPDGCLGGYYPELNVLVPLAHHDIQSKTPASKAVPVRIVANQQGI